MKRIQLRTEPAPPRTHVVLDSVQLLGLSEGIPNSIMVGIGLGRLDEQGNFVREALFGRGPLDGSPLYDKDPEAFDRVVDAVLAYLTEVGAVDGTKE